MLAQRKIAYDESQKNYKQMKTDQKNVELCRTKTVSLISNQQLFVL